MGKIRDAFSVKEMLWEGMNKAEYDRYCELLRSNNISIWAFTRNQETTKCSGECGKCGNCDFTEDTPTYKKIGSGLSVDLLNEKKDYEIYAIYVKKSELNLTKEIIGIK